MSVICGIYGFQITKPIELPGLRIEPRSNNFTQAKDWARDLKSYQLTAIIKADTISEDLIFNLEAILSFIEHLNVLISAPIEETFESDPFSQFPHSVTAQKRNNGGGYVIQNDTFFANSRGEFIAKALDRLSDPGFCKKTQFNVLFFKCIETFRQHKPFIEVSYFLLYSGLETYARSVTNDRSTKNSSAPICRVLKSHGFDIEEENIRDLPRAVSTYTHLRNALFHNSEFTATINYNGQTTVLELKDYLFNLSSLVSHLVLKAVDFDDQHINWNSWIDRQPFK